ncbi:hypothetical protein JG687_00008152, partial [Phytophthora cactorum]
GSPGYWCFKTAHGHPVPLLIAVFACFECLTGADDSVRVQNVQDNLKRNLKENTPRHLEGVADVGGDTTNEELRIWGVIKSKPFFTKPSNLAKVKQFFGKNPDIGKIQIAAGQKVDVTKLKTTSGKTVDLTKMNRKTAPVKEAVISKMKKLAEQDPDLRSISSVVGKSPTQLSVKQVLDVQSFIKKDPEGRLPLVFCVFLWWSCTFISVPGSRRNNCGCYCYSRHTTVHPK